MRIEGTPDSPEPNENLRGLQKFAKPTEEIGGAALGSVTSDPKGVLRGLENFSKHTTPGEAAIVQEIAPGAKVIQRDSGTVHQIEAIRDVKNGQVVNLVVRDGEGKLIRRVTLGYDDLQAKLETEGSAWRWA